MNTRIGRKRVVPFVLLSLFLCGLTVRLCAQPGPPGEGDAPDWLDFWSFDDTNTWSTFYGYEPVDFTNICPSLLGNGPALLVDSTNAAWLHYNISEGEGTNLLRVDEGSVMFWFAPSWSSVNECGEGPGDWGRLLEVGADTANGSYGWWSLYTDPEGTNLYFTVQTNGAESAYLSAPIAWTTNRWHLIALTYSATNSALYLDGELATNGAPVTNWPAADVLADGFWIGSASNGVAQARGMFDDLSTYDYALDPDTIASTFALYSIYYYLNPLNSANMVDAPSAPSAITEPFNAVTGAGYLVALSTNTTSCVTDSNIWITNVVASASGTESVDVAFEIEGGEEGVFYDVFANSVLDFSDNPDTAWSWVGQGQQCITYAVTNLPPTDCFLILGDRTDQDMDGLSDAYEKLVSKTDPTNPDTDGDSMLDGWEVLWKTDPRVNEAESTGKRANYVYNMAGWLNTLTGIKDETIGLDAEGNVETAH